MGSWGSQAHCMLETMHQSLPAAWTIWSFHCPCRRPELNWNGCLAQCKGLKNLWRSCCSTVLRIRSRGVGPCRDYRCWCTRDCGPHWSWDCCPKQKILSKLPFEDCCLGAWRSARWCCLLRCLALPCYPSRCSIGLCLGLSAMKMFQRRNPC